MLIEKIKSDSLEARKARDTDRATLLVTLFSEASMVGKNDGNRKTNDAEVLQVVQKFVKNAIEVQSVLLKNGKDTGKVQAEIKILNSYLPQQMTQDELGSAIRGIIKGLGEDKSPKLMGEVMGMLKILFAGQYDGKMASKIVREYLS